MTGARYLIRFDDICPTMNWPVWENIESLLKQHDIKPIVAVVPDNQDPKLEVGPASDTFWERVRSWQSVGWFNALHGYQHTYVTKDAGILGVNAYSEFAGLSYEIQREKLTKAAAIFTKHHIRVDGWVAPAHSFDATTIRVLLELGIDVISDGFFARPVEYLGAKWVPQQLWQFRKMPLGLWTVCFHINNFTDTDIEQFRRDIEYYAHAITSVEKELANYVPVQRRCEDWALSTAWLTMLRWKRRLRQWQTT